MPTLSNLRKSIHYLQQAIRNEYKEDKDLLKALDILAKRELKSSREEWDNKVGDINNYNTTEI